MTSGQRKSKDALASKIQFGGNYKGITKATLPPDIWIITGGLPSTEPELDN